MSHKTGQVGRKKTQVSFVIREAEERRHRAGINALQLDSNMSRLYSAGRDSIIRVWNCSQNVQEPYITSMEHHTDWVNDIVLCGGGRNLISASSDTTVKVWNAHKGFCMSTLRTHKDYVQALAYAKDKEQVASAGLDKAIFLWDVNTLTALTASNNTVTTSSLCGNKESIYSLAMNPSGTVIASGSTENVIRFWDPRTCLRLMKLKGHSDNIKALVVSKDGNRCLSGSSDGTIKLWSIGEQRCMQTIHVHSGAVWTLLATESFSHVISGGRDKRVYMTELRNTDHKVLICEEKNFILNLCFSVDYQSVWVTTADSDIRCWKLPRISHISQECAKYTPSLIMTIKGAAAIRQYHILNDKRHVLTKDSELNVALYDVLQASKVEDLGHVDFEKEITNRFKKVYVPNWFNVDLKIGMLSINLGQDEVDCFAAWVSARDAGLPSSVEPDKKVNYGNLLLQALLQHWTSLNIEREIYEQITVPNHTPLIFSEVGGRTLYRLLVKDASGENESSLLNDTIPQWVVEIIVNRDIPKFNKISFYLLPHPSVSPHILKQDKLKRDRLVANDFIQCRKVAEHVIDKVLNAEVSSGSPQNQSDNRTMTTSTNNSTSANLMVMSSAPNNTTNFGVGEGDGPLPEERVELLCNEQVLSPTMDLRTVRHFIWKSSADLMIHYKPIK